MYRRLGVMEDSPMPRLYRDAPINAIWEGSGNVQCLDVLRAISRKPETLEACFAEVETALGAHPALDAHLAALKDDMRDLPTSSRAPASLCDRLALALQASAMVKGAPSANADAFCRSRLEGRGQRNWARCQAGWIWRRSLSARRRDRRHVRRRRNNRSPSGYPELRITAPPRRLSST